MSAGVIKSNQADEYCGCHFILSGSWHKEKRCPTPTSLLSSWHSCSIHCQWLNDVGECRVNWSLVQEKPTQREKGNGCVCPASHTCMWSHGYPLLYEDGESGKKIVGAAFDLSWWPVSGTTSWDIFTTSGTPAAQFWHVSALQRYQALNLFCVSCSLFLLKSAPV